MLGDPSSLGAICIYASVNELAYDETKPSFGAVSGSIVLVFAYLNCCIYGGKLQYSEYPGSPLLKCSPEDAIPDTHPQEFGMPPAVVSLPATNHH